MRRLLLLSLACCIFVLAGSDNTRARILTTPEGPFFTPVGHMATVAHQFFLQQDQLTLLFEDELALYNIQQPATPTLIATMPILNGRSSSARTHSVAMHNDYAFISWKLCITCEQSLSLFDLTDPQNPQFVTDLIDTAIYDHLIHGNILYARYADHIKLFDITNPTQPTPISQITIPDNFGFLKAHQNAAGQTLLYIISQPSNGNILQIVDVTTPQNPNEINSTTISTGDFYELELLTHNNDIYLYYTTSSRVYAINVTNPQAPVTQNIYQDPDYIIDMTQAEGQLILVVDGGPFGPRNVDTLKLFDISNPLQPVHHGSYETTNVRAFTKVNNVLYTSLDHAFETLNIADPTAVFPTRQIPTFDSTSLDVYQNHIITHNETGIIDITDPSSPQQVGQIEAYAQEEAMIHVYDHYALIASFMRLSLVDISNPQNPVELMNRNTTYTVVTAIETYQTNTTTVAYISSDACFQLGCTPSLVSVDFVNPNFPVIRTILDGVFVDDLHIIDNYLIAYSQGNNDTLTIWDITDPIAPIVVSATPTAIMPDTDSQAATIAVVNNTLYLMGNFHDPKMQVWDISNRAAPQLLNTISTNSFIMDAVTEGTHLFTIDRDSQLTRYDLSQPSTPTIVEQRPITRGVNQMAINSDLLFLYGEGLTILKIPYTPPPPPSPPTLGFVRDVWQRPFADITINANGTPVATTTADGSYTPDPTLTGTNTLQPELTAFTAYPPSYTVNLDNNSSLHNFTLLGHPATTTLTNTITTTLTYTDTQQFTTTLTFPTSTVSHTTPITYTPHTATSGNDLLFVGNAFTLDSQHPVTFNTPITLTIHYNPYGIRLARNTSMQLMIETDTGWQNATTTCKGHHLPVHNTITQTFQTNLCQTGTYALFAPTHQVWLPVVNHMTP